MQTLKTIFVFLLLATGAYVLFLVLPPYWGNFKLNRMLEDQAVVLTYQHTVSDDEIAQTIADKARAMDVPLSADQVKVTRTPGELQITAEYVVHVENPVYGFDMNFKASTTNQDVMLKK